MNYEAALDYIARRPQRQYRGGLERMRTYLERAGLGDFLGNGSPAYLHIAGTNGKGSVTAYLQSILAEAGINSGAFFSPFVYDPRERVQLGRSLIPEADFAAITTRLAALADEELSEFEFKFALAVAYWKQCGCNAVALEVGLGGKFDATNVVAPAVTAIVSIGLDHTAILGETYAEIAAQKAGIIKPGVPAVVGNLPLEALTVMRRVAAEQSAPLYVLGEDFQIQGDRLNLNASELSGLVPGIPGAMQRENMAVAVACALLSKLDIPTEAIIAGVQRAQIPGRFEVHSFDGLPVVLDGAHNGEAAEVLRCSVESRFPGQKLTLISGMARGHDPVRFYAPLQEVIDAAFFVTIPNPRAVPASDLREISPWTESFESKSPVEALTKALDRGNPILVTGSFYLLSAIRAQLMKP